MEYSVGDMVMHPRLGAGQITGIEHQEWVEGFENYYVIQIAGKGLTVRLPFRKMDDMGVRHIMTEDKMSRTLRILSSEPRLLTEDANDRYKEIRELLDTGLPTPVAEVVRDLTWHRERAHLTKRDADSLAQAKELLISEMALVTGGQPADIEQSLDSVVEAAVAKRLEVQSAEQEAAAPA